MGMEPVLRMPGKGKSLSRQILFSQFLITIKMMVSPHDFQALLRAVNQLFFPFVRGAPIQVQIGILELFYGKSVNGFQSFIQISLFQ